MMTDTFSSTTLRLATHGLPPILLGGMLYVVGRPLDGFWGGFFQGATIMLMILGAFLVGDALWGGRLWGDRDSADERGWWLPSRDAEASGQRQLPADDDR